MATIVESIGDQPALFLDLSSSCSGYCIAQVNSSKEVEIIKVGVLWYENEEHNGTKYYKTTKFIKELCRDYQIKSVVSEAYYTNPYKTMGCNVCAELHGAIQSGLQELSNIPTWSEIAPQSWRSGGLKVKKDPTLAGSSSWKVPTRKRIEDILGVVFPDKIKSNINNKLRKTPYDLFDAIGICIGYLSLPVNNYSKFILKTDII